MKTTDLALPASNMDLNIGNDTLSGCVSHNIQEIEKFSRKINEAKEKAEKASKKVNEAIRQAERVKKHAAENQHEVTVFGGRKEAIECLQENTKEMAALQMDMADIQKQFSEAQKDANEALEQIFKYQQKITEALKFLLWLSCNNVATTRIIFDSLKEKLEGASKKQLSKFAEQELNKVVYQLRQQLDIHEKQEKIEQHIKEQRQKIKEHDKLIASGAEKDAEQDKILEEIKTELNTLKNNKTI